MHMGWVKITFLGNRLQDDSPYAIGRTVCCLSVLSCLSVTLVYCGQTVGWIKMKLGIEVGRGLGHIAFDGEPVLQKGAQAAPNFWAHVNCSQTVAHLSYC